VEPTPHLALVCTAEHGCNQGMDRDGNKSRSFADAERYDREQQWRMTSDERLLAAAELRERVYGKNCPDVREAERLRRRSEPGWFGAW